MLNLINLPQSSESVHFVWAKDLETDDLVGKYIFPYHDLMINITLENVQLRDSFENAVYEQLLPFQKFCIDQYKSINSKHTNSILIEDRHVCGFGFILYDPKTDEKFFTVHHWKKPESRTIGCFLELIKLDRPIPGTETNVLIPSNITVSEPDKPLSESIIRDVYIKTWSKELKTNPFEYGMYMDKTFYGKTPFHIRNYFQNGGKSLKQMIDTDLYR